MHLQYLGGSLVSGLWQPDRLDAYLRESVEHGWLINNCQAEAASVTIKLERPDNSI